MEPKNWCFPTGISWTPGAGFQGEPCSTLGEETGEIHTPRNHWNVDFSWFKAARRNLPILLANLHFPRATSQHRRSGWSGGPCIIHSRELTSSNLVGYVMGTPGANAQLPKEAPWEMAPMYIAICSTSTGGWVPYGTRNQLCYENLGGKPSHLAALQH